MLRNQLRLDGVVSSTILAGHIGPTRLRTNGPGAQFAGRRLSKPVGYPTGTEDREPAAVKPLPGPTGSEERPAHLGVVLTNGSRMLTMVAMRSMICKNKVIASQGERPLVPSASRTRT